MGVSFAPSVEPASPHPPPAFAPSARRIAPTYAHPRRRQPSALSRPPQGVGARPCLLYRPPTIREVGRTRPSAFMEAHTARISLGSRATLSSGRVAIPFSTRRLAVPFCSTAFYPPTPSRVLVCASSHRCSRRPPFEREKRGGRRHLDFS